MDRRELGAFLRSRRERIQPAEVGLPAGVRRRTPGLRRDEVAHLAFISTEYYTRLEQARAPRPSNDVIAGVARALRLSDSETVHLHRLAGVAPRPPLGPPRLVRRSIVDFIERLPDAAAIVTSAAMEVLAWNHLAAALMEDFSACSRTQRNLLRRAFLDSGPDGTVLFGVSDVEEFRRYAVAQLRSCAARYPDDPEVAALIAELRAAGALFEDIWQRREVAAEPVLRKTFRHPAVGDVTVNCDGLDIADSDQQLITYTADPGSADEQALKLLSVLGVQRLGQPG